MKINMNKIIKEIEKVEKSLKNTAYHLTTKGIIHLTINLIEEQLNEK